MSPHLVEASAFCRTLNDPSPVKQAGLSSSSGCLRGDVSDDPQKEVIVCRFSSSDEPMGKVWQWINFRPGPENHLQISA